MTRSRLVGVDVGGTFTDVMAIDDGRVIAAKIPTNVLQSETSVLQGAAEVGVDQARVFNLASTAGLNAVITRRIPKVAFLTTIGHRDILDRARLWRPFEALTDPSWRRGTGDMSRPLVPRYLRRGIRERLTSDGRVFLPLDEVQTREELEVLRECEVQGVAICLLHSYLNPRHEVRLRELVHEVLGDVEVSISSEVSPHVREYTRSTTTTIDLLMKLKYREYTLRLEEGLDELGFRGQFNYADCSAMLMPAAYAMERPHKLVVGGPAAGTVACAHFGSHLDLSDVLCADVGGTSCDISLVLDGRPWVNDTFELEWDLVVNALSTEIVTLGAGGGSIVSIGSSGELRVGPDSAGADPGPACYGKGGTAPTITDAAVSIGVISPEHFVGGKVPLHAALAVRAFEALDTSLPLSERIRQSWLLGLHNISEGIIDIAIRRGLDVRDLNLMAYGAAGPMMLPGLLDLLPLRSVIVPPNPGGFSALGLVSADRVYSESRTLHGVLGADLAPRLAEMFESLEQGLLQQAEVSAEEATIRRTFDGRLLGQGWETPFVPVPAGPLGAKEIEQMIEAFHAEYEQRNGHRFASFPVEGVTYRVQVVVPSDKVKFEHLAVRRDGALEARATTELSHLYPGGATARCYERDDLLSGDVVDGPAIVWETNSTTFVPMGRSATVGGYGELVVT
ncbi:MAG TPA: hydantoinase/oxoprolinase family protein [Acidimicrobiales bacterium]